MRTPPRFEWPSRVTGTRFYRSRCHGQGTHQRRDESGQAGSTTTGWRRRYAACNKHVPPLARSRAEVTGNFRGLTCDAVARSRAGHWSLAAVHAVRCRLAS
jgi:hypothetical protein